MTLHVVLTPGAANDLIAAFDWYQRFCLGLGVEFIADFDSALEGIGQQPKAYQRITGEIRALSLRRFPYRAFFEPHPSCLLVLAVLHEHADFSTRISADH